MSLCGSVRARRIRQPSAHAHRKSFLRQSAALSAGRLPPGCGYAREPNQTAYAVPTGFRIAFRQAHHMTLPEATESCDNEASANRSDWRLSLVVALRIARALHLCKPVTAQNSAK